MSQGAEMARRKRRKSAGDVILKTAINLLAAVFFFYVAINGVGNSLINFMEKQTKTNLSDTKKQEFLENINPLYSSPSQPTHGTSYLNLNAIPAPSQSAKDNTMGKIIWEIVGILVVFLPVIGAIHEKHKKSKQQEIINKSVSNYKARVEHERKKEAYLKQQAELLKTQPVAPKKPKDLNKYTRPVEQLKIKSIEPENTRPLKSKNDRSFAYLGGSAFVWSDDFMKSLEWKRFEEVCAELLKIQGYNAKVTCVGADGGVDIVIKDNNGLVVSVAQCKAFGKKPIGVSLIRELFGIMASENVKQGLFFTTSTFSSDAVEFAKNKNMKLIDLRSFVCSISALDSDSRERLYKVATEGNFTTPTCARCDVKMVKRVASTNKSVFWGCPNFPKCRSIINVRA